MKRPLLLLLLAVVVPLVTAGGYDHGKATGTCFSSPDPVAINTPYVVSASGLNVGYPVLLRIIPPPGDYTGSISYGYVTDGSASTWSGTFSWDDPGKWSYEFDYRNPASKSWTMQTVAKCTATLTA